MVKKDYIGREYYSFIAALSEVICRNDLLNRFTAEATGLPVIAGPVKATASGNLLMQAFALGEIGSLDELRDIVCRSFETKKYDVTDSRDTWETVYEEYKKLIKRSR
jgi:rhamnulokinase